MSNRIRTQDARTLVRVDSKNAVERVENNVPYHQEPRRRQFMVLLLQHVGGGADEDGGGADLHQDTM